MVKTLDHLALELDLLARFVHEWPLGSASQFRKQDRSIKNTGRCQAHKMLEHSCHEMLHRSSVRLIVTVMTVGLPKHA